MSQALRALHHPNYRLFFIGQAISLIGTWMQSVALQWLIYRMTGSAVLLGTVTFATLIPTFIISPFAGVVIDRMDKRRVIIATQVLFLLEASILGALVLAGTIQVWQILALSAAVGIASAFDMPGRQAFMVEIVERPENLGNAIALNSSQFNLARLIGPPIAGLVIHLFGEGICFLLNAASYIAVIGALLAIRIPAAVVEVRTSNMAEELRDGFNYVWNFVPVRLLLIFLALISFITGTYAVLTPVFAKDIFKGDAQTLGMLLAAVGVGAVASAFLLASKRSVLGLGGWLVNSALLFGACLIGYGESTSFLIALPMLAGIGFGMMSHMTATNTLVQTIIENRMRGRVMAFYTMAFVGTMPIGSLICGFVSAAIGPRLTLVIAGGIAIFASLLFRLVLPRIRELVRPIYIERGILEAEVV